MKRGDFRIGDRVEKIGRPDHPYPCGPENGEQGTIVDLDPHDDVISWDVAHTTTWDVEDGTVRLVAGAPRGIGGGSSISADGFALRVQGELPSRSDPSRSADRHSPYTDALFSLAVWAQRLYPDHYPARREVGLVVVTGSPAPMRDGYSVASAIAEILVDAGALEDERLVAWERCEIDPDLTGGFSVSIELALAD